MGTPNGTRDGPTLRLTQRSWRDLCHTPRLTHLALRAYVTLLTFADAEGECWPSRTTLADAMNLPLSTVARALRDLEKLGLTQRVATKGRVAVRRVIPPPPAELRLTSETRLKTETRLTSETSRISDPRLHESQIRDTELKNQGTCTVNEDLEASQSSVPTLEQERSDEPCAAPTAEPDIIRTRTPSPGTSSPAESAVTAASPGTGTTTATQPTQLSVPAPAASTSAEASLTSPCSPSDAALASAIPTTLAQLSNLCVRMIGVAYPTPSHLYPVDEALRDIPNVAAMHAEVRAEVHNYLAHAADRNGRPSAKGLGAWLAKPWCQFRRNGAPPSAKAPPRITSHAEHDRIHAEAQAAAKRGERYHGWRVLPSTDSQET
jgi:hypothetical protein